MMVERTSACECGTTFTFIGKCAKRCPKCKAEKKLERVAQQCRMRREQGAALNGGEALGKHNKDLAERLKPMVLRSYKEVGDMLGLSGEAVRQVEQRALAKLRAFLDPYKRERRNDQELLPPLVLGLPIHSSAGNHTKTRRPSAPRLHAPQLNQELSVEVA